MCESTTASNSKGLTAAGWRRSGSFKGICFQRDSLDFGPGALSKLKLCVVCHWLCQCKSKRCWHLGSTGRASGTPTFIFDEALGHFLPVFVKLFCGNSDRRAEFRGRRERPTCPFEQLVRLLRRRLRFRRRRRCHSRVQQGRRNRAHSPQRLAVPVFGSSRLPR